MLDRILIDYWISFVLSRYNLLYLRNIIHIEFSSKIKSLGIVKIYNDKIIIKMFKYEKGQFNLSEATETLVHELSHVICFYLYGHVKHNRQMKEIMKGFSFEMT